VSFRVSKTSLPRQLCLDGQASSSYIASRYSTTSYYILRNAAPINLKGTTNIALLYNHIAIIARPKLIRSSNPTMPAATRRTTRGAPPKGAQSTLSFGNRSRVTKNTAPIGKDAKKAEAEAVKAEKPEAIDIEDDDDVDIKGQEVKAEPAKSKQETVLDTLTPVEKEAEKISQSQIMKYWKAREDERMAPRGQ